MAAGDHKKALLAGGRLAFNVTNMSLAWPHGGTGLGIVGDIQLIPPRLSRVLIEEETNSPFGLIWLGGPLEVRARAKGWEVDAVSKLMPGGGNGANGPKIDFPSSNVGKTPATLTNVVFTPDRSSNPHWALFGVQAVPDEDDPKMEWSAYKYLTFRFRLIATGTNTEGLVGYVRAKADFVL